MEEKKEMGGEERMRLIIVCRQVTSLSLSSSHSNIIYMYIKIWSYLRVCQRECRPLYTHVATRVGPYFVCVFCVIRDGMCSLQKFFSYLDPRLPVLSVVDIPVIIIAKEYIPSYYIYLYEMLCVSGDGKEGNHRARKLHYL